MAELAQTETKALQEPAHHELLITGEPSFEQITDYVSRIVEGKTPKT